MTTIKTDTIHSKNMLASMDSEQERQKDEAVTAMIRGLDLFIAQANRAGLGTASRILYTAKEDLVYWAAQMGFFESESEKFINRNLYNNGLFAAADFIACLASIRNKKVRDTILEGFKMGSSTSALVEELKKCGATHA